MEWIPGVSEDLGIKDAILRGAVLAQVGDSVGRGRWKLVRGLEASSVLKIKRHLEIHRVLVGVENAIPDRNDAAVEVSGLERKDLDEGLDVVVEDGSRRSGNRERLRFKVAHGEPDHDVSQKALLP